MDRAVGDVAVKIFRDGDLGRERAPAFRHFDVLLLENDLAAVVGDLRGAPFPFDLVERRDFRVAENALETQRRFFFFAVAIFAAIGAIFCGLLSEEGEFRV